MAKRIINLIPAALMVLLSVSVCSAHFGMIIPSDDIVSKQDKKEIFLKIQFAHPFERQLMNMEKPKAFGYITGGATVDLLKTLQKKDVNGLTAWQAAFKIKRPGDYVFFIEPKPYWEPAEEAFIVHYTKVVVNALGLEQGWDSEVGMKTEIIPLTRPYGLWAGNVFQGVVKVDSKPAPFTEVEIEYYNDDGKINAPDEPYVTQLIKTDSNGVFTYAMPKAGWWGFAALSTADYKIKHEGKEYPVEIGAVIWVKTSDLK